MTTWALTMWWALARDTTVYVYYTQLEYYYYVTVTCCDLLIIMWTDREIEEAIRNAFARLGYPTTTRSSMRVCEG